jgi:hypothetical protein
MIICIEIDQKIKSKLDELMKGGEYRDYSQAVGVAISNQVLLHERFAQNGGSLIVDAGNTSRRETGADIDAVETMPTVFALPRPIGEMKFAPVPGDVFVPGAVVPLDRWIFGQHNKLLPAKASCRWLANVPNGKGVPLAKAASEIAACSAELGDHLQSHDD